MTEGMATPTGAPTEFDKWQTVSVAIFIALVGYTVMVSFPVLATALVEKAGFSEVEVGQIWGADMFGFSIGAILVAFIVAGRRRRERHLHRRFRGDPRGHDQAGGRLQPAAIRLCILNCGRTALPAPPRNE
jgi:hypothetical protein